ncbi:recombination mediator RecR [Defluviicoccus vanus]|uniref:Recombination protein RecR n=1 Tax=Defluviicoccus vanus TaxID=111831 RepID=A0A7H1MYK0_9PROT|nr:recombination mediator RecR [Defluviicoccus vanus]QNT68536.1 recombination protein RecR [Defluviicoccus vanus]
MSDIERLIQSFAKLPGLGPRSARRAVLHLLKRRETVLQPLLQALVRADASVRNCQRCGNLDDTDPCGICGDPRRDGSCICVVEDVSDLWALERSGAYRGHYHVLGGLLSALDGIGPDELRIPRLVERASEPTVREVIMAVSFTVDGQTTAFYIAERLAGCDVRVSGIAHGVPLGGELHYLDDATLATALQARRQL